MAKHFTLDKYSKSMQDATIIEWFVQPGDVVNIADKLVHIETDKAAMDIEAPFQGCITKILVEPNMTVPIETALVVYSDKKGDAPESLIDKLNAKNADLLENYRKLQAQEQSKKPDVSVAPALKTDVEPVSGKKLPLSRLQKITAKKMLQSKSTIPCFYLNTKADVTELVEFRKELNSVSNVKVSFNDLIIYALGIAMEKYPVMTGRLTEDSIILADLVSVGLAVSAAAGLVAPVIKDVPSRSLIEVAAASTGLIEKAKANTLSPDDLEGASITVSNLGGFGIDSFIPVVLPGQCSIIGVGRIADACVSCNRAPAVRKIMNLNLSVDHKVVNGADASQFLDFLRKLLENTETFK
ncbi:MAG: 2-oxo acid dehydrogenase subunit E2 [Planctomycetes bacterium]|nr:2-oxo acid dehydrogenase subunit E2 [Planctomycetota bacterium]